MVVTTMLALSMLDRDAAVRLLVDEACGRSFAIAVHLLGSRADAEDAVQEALARALAGVHRVRDAGALHGWFYRVLINICMRMLRRRRLADGIKRMFGASGEPVVDADGLAPDNVRMLAEIARLPPMQKTTLVLHHAHDVPIDEIARAMEIGEETVKTHLKRARARARLRTPWESTMIRADDPLARAVARALHAQCSGPPADLRVRLLAGRRAHRAELVAIGLAATVAAAVTLAIVLRPADRSPDVRAPLIAPAGPSSPTIRVTTDPPGARVALDGVVLGDTPLDAAIARGRHRLSITRAGYRALDRIVDVAGADVVVHVALDREPSPPSPPPGTLELRATPRARVTVGGKAAGATPLRIDLPPGRHFVEVRWDDGRSTRASVAIRSGKTSKISYDR